MAQVNVITNIIMTQNTLEIVPSSPQETVASLDQHREKKVSTKYNRPHCIVPIDDLKWLVNQGKNVQTLWNECWATDQYGSRWIKLTTSLSDKAFRLARQVLYKSGLFEFKRETNTQDARKTAYWVVKNLHDARRIQEFWMRDDESEIDHTSLLDQPNNSINLPDDGQKMPDISTETIENTGLPQVLSNASGTSQELLKEVPEEVNQVKTSREVLEGLRALKTKAGEKLARMLSAKFKALDSGNEEDYFREKFEIEFRWQIPPEKLAQLMELNRECRAVFFATFKNLYEFGKLFGSKAFDQAITGIKENADYYIESARCEQEYWHLVFSRRDQLLGHT